MAFMANIAFSVDLIHLVCQVIPEVCRILRVIVLQGSEILFSLIAVEWRESIFQLFRILTYEVFVVLSSGPSQSCTTELIS